jgi:mannitol/fructose-specific phosphotransferase system IIA component (Ntr-type)
MILQTELPATITERDDAIRFLLNELIRLGLVPENQFSPLFQGLLTRESIGSTAIGRGVAIPHLRVKGLDDFRVLRGHSAKGVPWAGQSVHFAYLVLSPNDNPGGHLRLLEHIYHAAREEGAAG